MSQIRKVFFAVSLLCCFISMTGAMKCVFERQKRSGIDAIDAVQDRLASCPPLLFEQEKEFCCVDTEFKSYCCNLPEFVINISLWLIPMVIILLIISSVVSCVCCLCCPCCFAYKRRHGRVYRTEVPPISTSPPYQPVEQQQFMPHNPNGSSTTATNRPHLPPGAYPVFPQITGTYYGTFETAYQQ